MCFQWLGDVIKVQLASYHIGCRLEDQGGQRLGLPASLSYQMVRLCLSIDIAQAYPMLQYCPAFTSLVHVHILT